MMRHRHFIFWVFHKMFAVRLPEEIEVRLTALVEKTGRSRTSFVKEALIEWLDEKEDLYLGEQRLLAVLKGEDKLLSLDEMKERFLA